MRRVRPPTTTIPKTIALTPNNQYATGRYWCEEEDEDEEEDEEEEEEESLDPEFEELEEFGFGILVACTKKW